MTNRIVLHRPLRQPRIIPRLTATHPHALRPPADMPVDEIPATHSHPIHIREPHHPVLIDALSRQQLTITRQTQRLRTTRGVQPHPRPRTKPAPQSHLRRNLRGLAALRRHGGTPCQPNSKRLTGSVAPHADATPSTWHPSPNPASATAQTPPRAPPTPAAETRARASRKTGTDSPAQNPSATHAPTNPADPGNPPHPPDQAPKTAAQPSPATSGTPPSQSDRNDRSPAPTAPSAARPEPSRTPSPTPATPHRAAD